MSPFFLYEFLNSRISCYVLLLQTVRINFQLSTRWKLWGWMCICCCCCCSSVTSQWIKYWPHLTRRNSKHRAACEHLQHVTKEVILLMVKLTINHEKSIGNHLRLVSPSVHTGFNSYILFLDRRAGSQASRSLFHPQVSWVLLGDDSPRPDPSICWAGNFPLMQ